jgi:hypothetical protein
MKSSDIEADLYVLLFSSDWFEPYWHLLGLKVPEEQASSFQAALRKASLEMIDGAKQYWFIHFTESRVISTRQNWLHALQSHCAGSSRLELLNRWQYSPQERMEFKWWLRERFAEDSRKIEAAVLDSTEWDQWLTDLTPDLPDMLKTTALSAYFDDGDE